MYITYKEFVSKRESTFPGDYIGGGVWGKVGGGGAGFLFSTTCGSWMYIYSAFIDRRSCTVLLMQTSYHTYITFLFLTPKPKNIGIENKFDL